jgi:hypothetical protein
MFISGNHAPEQASAEYGHTLYPMLVVKDNKNLNKEHTLKESLFSTKNSYMNGELSAERFIAYTWTVCDGTRYHLRKGYSFWILSVAICPLFLKEVYYKGEGTYSCQSVGLTKCVNPWISESTDHSSLSFGCCRQRGWSERTHRVLKSGKFRQSISAN